MTRDHHKGLLAIRQVPPSANLAKFHKSIFAAQCEDKTTETFTARNRLNLRGTGNSHGSQSLAQLRPSLQNDDQAEPRPQCQRGRFRNARHSRSQEDANLFRGTKARRQL
jgi:hypothetical protein